MIEALLLLFSPADTWERMGRAPRSFGYIAFTYLIPLLILSCFIEGYGLYQWGKWQGEVPHIKKWPFTEAAVFEAGQFAVLAIIILVNSAIVKSVGETFHARHTLLQSFTVVSYGLFPFLLARMLDAFRDITPWVAWLIGILLTIGLLYHGVPRVMLPDPAHAFGLYMTTALLLFLSTGLLEFVVAFFLDGKLVRLERVISALAERLHF